MCCFFNSSTFVWETSISFWVWVRYLLFFFPCPYLRFSLVVSILFFIGYSNYCVWMILWWLKTPFVVASVTRVFFVGNLIWYPPIFCIFCIFCTVVHVGDVNNGYHDPTPMSQHFWGVQLESLDSLRPVLIYIYLNRSFFSGKHIEENDGSPPFNGIK